MSRSHVILFISFSILRYDAHRRGHACGLAFCSDVRFTIVFFKTLHLQLIRRCNQSLANGRRAKCNVATAYILAMSDHRLL